MKKIFVFVFLILFLLTGCINREVPDTTGDFSFLLPEGYLLENVSDRNCFISSKNGTVVGGIEATNFRYRDLNDDETKNIMLYLQNDFHNTNNIEFIASHWGTESPIVSINLTKTDDTTEEKSHYSHKFFEKTGTIYHVWLSLDIIEPAQADLIFSAVLAE